MESFHVSICLGYCIQIMWYLITEKYRGDVLQQKLTDLEGEWDDKINIKPHLRGLPISNFDINFIDSLSVCP